MQYSEKMNIGRRFPSKDQTLSWEKGHLDAFCPSIKVRMPHLWTFETNYLSLNEINNVLPRPKSQNTEFQGLWDKLVFATPSMLGLKTLRDPCILLQGSDRDWAGTTSLSVFSSLQSLVPAPQFLSRDRGSGGWVIVEDGLQHKSSSHGTGYLHIYSIRMKQWLPPLLRGACTFWAGLLKLKKLLSIVHYY